MTKGHGTFRVLFHAIFTGLSVTALEEERNRSRARMRSDDASDHVHEEIARSEAIFDEADEVVDIRLAIAVADENGIVFPERLEFRHLIDERGKRLLSSHRLADRDEVSRIVHMKDGFDVEHLSDDSRRTGHSSAALQVEQIVHREEVADVPL